MSWRAAICTAGLMLAAPALARADSARFDIVAQPLATALKAFAAQAHMQLLYQTSAVTRFTGKPIAGEWDKHAALEQLLKGTGLEAIYSIDNAVTIRPARASGSGARTLSLPGNPGPTAADPPAAQLQLAQAEPGSPPAASSAERRSDQDLQRDLGSGALEEIVVTANKREENAQSVASSVSVLNGEQLVQRNLTQLTDYAAYVPGVNIVNGGTPGSSTIVVRGITTLDTGALVGTYIDETPMGSSSGWGYAAATALDLPPYDIERLEVLRGPQGTLYGASTMGGLLKYVLKQPSLEHVEVKVGADLSMVQGASGVGTTVRALVNVPVNEQMALLFDGYDTRTPGYIDNAYTGIRDGNAARQDGGRAALLWQPATALSVKLNAFWFRDKADDLNNETYTGMVPVANPQAAFIIDTGSRIGDLTQSHAFAQSFKKSIDVYSATIDWNPGAVDVISATSWSRSKAELIQDLSTSFGSLYPLLSDGAIAEGLNRYDFSASTDKFTEELRAVSPQGRRVEWTAGAFFTSEQTQLDEYSVAYDTSYAPIAAFAPYFFFAVPSTNYREIAGFADLTWHITERFDITGGARYAHNTQHFDLDAGGAIFPAGTSTADSSEGVWTYMGNTRFHLTDDTMLYARVASGYRPGAPNTPGLGVPNQYAADTLVNYELGMKSEFLERRALIDATLFYIDWHNIQLTEQNNFGVQYIANGGEAVSKGLELSTAYSPLRGLNLGFNATYTKAELTSLDAAADYLLTAYQLPNVPKWSLSATTSYDWTLPNQWRAHVGGGVRWIDKEWSSVVALNTGLAGAAIELPSYTTLELDSSLNIGKVRLRIFARNLTNKRALQGALINSALGVPESVDFAIMQPRTIGAGCDYTF